MRPTPPPMLALVTILLLSQTGAIQTEERALVAVFCYDDTTQGYLKTMLNFARDLAVAIEEQAGDKVEAVACTSFSELYQYLNAPYTVAAVVSLAGSPEFNSSPALAPYFRDGVGMVGFNHVCMVPFSPDLAQEVFPIFGNASSLGVMTRIGVAWIRTRTYKRSADHPIADGLPENFTLPDYELTFCSRSDREFSQGWPIPEDGDYTVVYTTTGRESPYTDKTLPGVVAYEKIGRSVSLPGFYATELPGVTSYHNFINNTYFVKLVSNAVLWVSESGIASREHMLPSFTKSLEGFKADLMDKQADLDSWLAARSRNKTLLKVLILSLGGVGVVLTLFLGFARGGEG